MMRREAGFSDNRAFLTSANARRVLGEITLPPRRNLIHQQPRKIKKTTNPTCLKKGMKENGRRHRKIKERFRKTVDSINIHYVYF